MRPFKVRLTHLEKLANALFVRISKKEILQLLNSLSVGEREIIKMRCKIGHNLDYGRIYPFQEIARIFEVEISRVKEFEQHALDSLPLHGLQK